MAAPVSEAASGVALLLPAWVSAVGSILSGVSLLSAFAIYWLGKRDAAMTTRRGQIARVRANMERMARQIGYPLTSEVIQGVVCSNELEMAFDTVNDWFHEPGMTESELRKRLTKDFPPILVAVTSPIVLAFHDLAYAVDEEISVLQADFPALARVLYPTNFMMHQMVLGDEEAARDNEIVERTLVSLFEQGLEYCPDAAHIKRELYEALNAMGGRAGNKVIKDVEKAVTMTNMIVDKYVALSDARLSRQSRAERSRQYATTDSILEDYQEAEKGLASLLTQADMLSYRQTVTEIKTRREDTKKRVEELKRPA